VTDTRAVKLLDKLGIEYEREPDWITEGRKPDFYCSTRPKFWCEVKTLGELEDQRILGDALNELNNRASGIALPGQGIAHVSGRLSHQDAKVVMRLVKRAVARLADSDAPEIAVALIPKDPNRSEFVRFSISTKDHAKVEFHSCMSRTGKYETPNGMVPEPYDQMTRLRFSSGNESSIPAREVVKWSDDFSVAIVIYPDDDPFKVLTAMLTGAARRLKNPERIRGDVSDANEQLKNGIKYKSAPGLLLIYHDGLDVPDDMIIKSGLYGNLKYTAPKRSPSKGKLILDGDGAWNREKNRTTSAVAYIRNDGVPLLIHNYWAYRALRAGVLRCREVAALPNGTFDEVDFSPKWTANRPIDCLRRIRFRSRQLFRSATAWLR
jgi:hypothetical protein